MCLDQPLTSNKLSLESLIYIGASSVNLLIVDLSANCSPVDFLTQPIPLAQEIFRDGIVSRSTIERCVKIIEDYKTLLEEYSIPNQPLIPRLSAANILLEAENLSALSNRIQFAHQLEIETLDDGEMTRLIYVKTREILHKIKEFRQKNVLITHIGPANTRAITFNQGRVSHYASYRMGVYRTGEALEISSQTPTNVINLIREHGRGQLDQLFVDHRLLGIETFIAIGSEIQQLAQHLSKHHETTFSLKSLKDLAQHLAGLSSEERITLYDIDYTTADALLPSLVQNIALAESLGIEKMTIPITAYDSSLMTEIIRMRNNRQQDLENEVLHFADTLAEKYHTDKRHRQHVKKLLNLLYEQLSPLHHLSEHDKLLMDVAATLHEIGSFITSRQHNQHARYIISNTDIFGLNSQDVRIIALLVFLHRGEIPTNRTKLFSKYNTDDQLRISKMVALLRIAVGLDRSHAQRIKGITTCIHDTQLEITAQGVMDTTVESIALEEKGDLFQEIFGLDLILIPGL